MINLTARPHPTSTISLLVIDKKASSRVLVNVSLFPHLFHFVWFFDFNYKNALLDYPQLMFFLLFFLLNCCNHRFTMNNAFILSCF
jgi:hypothetical protein